MMTLRPVDERERPCQTAAAAAAAPSAESRTPLASLALDCPWQQVRAVKSGCGPAGRLNEDARGVSCRPVARTAEQPRLALTGQVSMQPLARSGWHKRPRLGQSARSKLILPGRCRRGSSGDGRPCKQEAGRPPFHSSGPLLTSFLLSPTNHHRPPYQTQADCLKLFKSF